MKKVILTSLCSFIFLILSSLVAYILRYFPLTIDWVYLIIAVILLIISGIIYILGHRYLVISLLCFLIGAVALGCSIRAWYLFRDFDNDFLTMFWVALSTVGYLWVFYLLLYLPFIEKHFNIYLWVYLILSVIGYTLIMAFTKTTYISTFGFYMIVEIAFIFLLCADIDNLSEYLQAMVFPTYSVIIVIIIIALLMLEVDSFDFDFSGSGDNLGLQSPKNKKVYYETLKPINELYD